MKILVLDPEWEQTAYLVSSLARAGHQVTLVSSLPRDRFGIGRYCEQVPAPGRLSDADVLKRLFAGSDHDLILPLSEEIMEALWALPAELTSRVFPQTTTFQRELLTDRRRMYQFAQSLAVPIPALAYLQDEASLAACITDLGLPLVLRGTKGLAGQQVRVVQNAQDAIDSFRLLKTTSSDMPFAQAFVQGRRCLIGALFDQGKALQWFSQTTIEASSTTGPSIRVRSVNDPRLTAYAKVLFENMQWTGLACAEFMRDEQGEYHFLEINPRPWAAIQAAHYCSIPLLDLFVDYLDGKLPPKTITVPDGVDIALFPQFIAWRLKAKRFLRWSDRRSYCQSLAGAPWRRPALLLHFLRRIWWSRA